MDDIWQKLIANHILIKLCEKGLDKLVKESTNTKYCISTKDEDFVEKNEYREYVKVAADFSRGTALINIIIHIGDKCVFGIQIQNGLYKRFLGTTKSHLRVAKGNDENNGIKNYYERFLTKLPGLFRFGDNYNWTMNEEVWEDKVFPKEKNNNAGIEGFGGYGATFLAQWRKISENASVEVVLDAMINDCLEVRRLLFVAHP
jgi:hypothetical protein